MDEDDFLGLIFWVLIIFVGAFESQGYKWFDDSYIPTYETYYSDPNTSSLSPDIEYFIQKSTNQVVSKNHDTGEIATLKDCSIVDRKNWTCGSSSYLKRMLNDGEYREQGLYSYANFKPLWRIQHFYKKHLTGNKSK